jgi:hypothetical protein
MNPLEVWDRYWLVMGASFLAEKRFLKILNFYIERVMLVDTAGIIFDLCVFVGHLFPMPVNVLLLCLTQPVLSSLLLCGLNLTQKIVLLDEPGNRPRLELLDFRGFPFVFTRGLLLGKQLSIGCQVLNSLVVILSSHCLPVTVLLAFDLELLLLDFVSLHGAGCRDGIGFNKRFDLFDLLFFLFLKHLFELFLSYRRLYAPFTQHEFLWHSWLEGIPDLKFTLLLMI